METTADNGDYTKFGPGAATRAIGATHFGLSVRRLAGKRPQSREAAVSPNEASGFVVEVLGADQQTLAGFVSEIEAYRYASLLVAPEAAPMFRRRSDGAIISFTKTATPASLACWVRG